MLQGWNFLIAEIWGQLALALLIGFGAGWLVFGKRATGGASGNRDDELNACRAEVSTLKVELEKMQRQGPTSNPAPAKPSRTIPKTASKPARTVSKKVPLKRKKPRPMKQARKGGPDDLKAIKGIGPELEKLCHRLGFYHFDQIAKWTKEEIAWVDENLEGFKGRVTRDKWVAQAKKLVT